MQTSLNEKEDLSGELIIEKRPAISVPIRSLQGAGDAMVAGLCKAIYEGKEDKMLEYAMTMAASTIMLPIGIFIRANCKGMFWSW